MLLEDNAHDALFSPATLMLGEIHWCLLKSANIMDAQRFTITKREGVLISTHEWTDFGNEVGQDEINWWIFKKETNVGELRGRTERALEAAQVLKQASAELGKNRPKTYDDLLSPLKDFAEQHAAEIKVLCEYVRWLEARDAMAPRILFTYRVWGSTRMSDRWIDIAPDAQGPTPETIRGSAVIVLGLSSGGILAYDRAYMEIGEEIWSSMDPTEIPNGGSIAIPERSVVPRAARQVYEDCATYFAEIRDSLRNVLIDISKFEEQRELMNSDAFWRDFIQKAVATKKTETQLWDFKETLTLWHVTEAAEKERAKATLAEDVASFANASGGVLVIGVQDKPREIVGVKDSGKLEHRLKLAGDVIAKYLEYPRDIAWFRQVALHGKDGEKICLVIVIAQACEAVGVHDGQGRYTYPVRRETGIDRVSRSEISTRKVHLKSDSRDFMRDLKQFVGEN